MSLNSINNYFLNQPEPQQSCLLFLRQFILNHSPNFTEEWKFNLPFYYYNKKWCCYLFVYKKTQKIHIGFMDGNKITHKKLLSEGRKQLKVFPIDVEKDIDIKTLNTLLNMAIKVKKMPKPLY